MIVGHQFRPLITGWQRISLILILTLALTLIWVPGVYADGPGSLDLTFNGTGVVTTSISSGGDIGRSVALQPDGKIVVAGESGPYLAVARYNSDGSLDTTFNNTGVLTTPIGSSSGGNSVALQPNGKIVVAGSSFNGVNTTKFVVVRYNNDGMLDPTFNGTGIVLTSIGGISDTGWSVALQPDGKIVVAGQSNDDFAVARYETNGVLDTTFNSTGAVTTSIGDSFDLFRSVAIQPDGKIVAAGSSDEIGEFPQFVVARYEISGTLDTTFNNTGILTTPPGLDSGVAFSVAIQPDGKIVASGGGNNAGDLIVVRYDENGKLDLSFNGTGVVTTPISSGYDFGVSVALQPDGKIVVAGLSDYNSGNEELVVVRYQSNGSLDTTFNGTGIVKTSIANKGTGGLSVAIQPDGKIVAAGFNGDVSTLDFAVVRYIIDGQPPMFLPVITKN
jgi:uncharacterized delta-60 repeat protein